jgi:hypothetical protein
MKDLRRSAFAAQVQQSRARNGARGTFGRLEETTWHVSAPSFFD